MVHVFAYLSNFVKCKRGGSTDTTYICFSKFKLSSKSTPRFRVLDVGSTIVSLILMVAKFVDFRKREMIWRTSVLSSFNFKWLAVDHALISENLSSSLRMTYTWVRSAYISFYRHHGNHWWTKWRGIQGEGQWADSRALIVGHLLLEYGEQITSLCIKLMAMET